MKKKKKILGKHIVADPEICHGKPTFKGTRIMVWQILEMVAEGTPWKEISKEWDGKVSEAAIGEAVMLARRALEEHPEQYGVPA
jgi:uncharacterized protein (DUF433 family)